MGGGLPVEIVQNGREKGNLEKGWRDLLDLSMLDNIAIIIVFIGLSFIAENSYTRR